MQIEKTHTKIDALQNNQQSPPEWFGRTTNWADPTFSFTRMNPRQNRATTALLCVYNIVVPYSTTTTTTTK